MPSGNKGGQGQSPNQGQGRGQHNGGVPQSEGDQGWKVGDQIREGAEHVGNRLQEGYSAARDGVNRGYRKAEGTIARNPAPSVLMGLGIGFGLGIVLSQMFGHEEESWSERNVSGPLSRLKMPESMKHVPDHVHHLADAILSRMPKSVRDHLG